MKKAKKLFHLILFFSLLFISSVYVDAKAEDFSVSLHANGKVITSQAKAFIRDGVTYADLNAISDAFSFKFSMYDSHESATVSDGSIAVCFTVGENYATICDLTGEEKYEYLYHELSSQCIFANECFYVAVRDFAEAFKYNLDFDKVTQTVYIGEKSFFSSSDFECGVYSQIPDGTTYYFQNQQDFQLPDYGSGYCWVCSYSMLITAVTGNTVIPNDVASVNLEHNSNGNYCYHSEIVSKFGVKFVPALSESSVFYNGVDSVSGGTYIKNPYSEDRVAIAALKQALLLHPEGVLVRYAAFPHTMVAIGFTGDTVYFNDPAPTSGSSYAPTGSYQGVPFEKTCVAAKGFRIADLTFVQAIVKK